MIVVCGEALIDLTPAVRGDEPAYLPRPGGSPYNTAVGLGRQGVPTAFLGRISEDPFGERLLDHLASNGVDLRYVRRGPEPTTVAFVHLEPGEEPRFAFYGRGTADTSLSPRDLPSELHEDVRAIHVGLGAITLDVEPAASTLRSVMERERERRFVSFDPNVRPGSIPERHAYRERLERWIGLTHLARVSRADLAWLYPGAEAEEVARRWLDLGPALVVVSLGGDGALALGRNAAVRVPGVPVEVVDTVGAGDSFTAGFLAALYRREGLDEDRLATLSVADLTEALIDATRAAAITCTRAGADPPTRQEVLRAFEE